MLRKLVRTLFWLALAQAATMAVGQVLSSRMSRGDEQSDVFQVAAVCGGRQFRSYARDLRSAAAVATMGGIDLDLSHAHLVAEGAHLDLRATMGGIKVVVPADWSVHVDAQQTAGGCETRVTPVEDLSEDAPQLRVHAVARMGGVLVTAKG